MTIREKEQSLRRAGFSRKEAKMRVSEWKRSGLLDQMPDKVAPREVGEPADKPELLREVATTGFLAGVRGLFEALSFERKAGVRTRSANTFATKSGEYYGQ